MHLSKAVRQRLIGAAIAILASAGLVGLQAVRAAAPAPGQTVTTPIQLGAAAGQRPVLRQGASGDLVRWLQHRLGGGLTGTGYFGSKTDAAVRAFQAQQKLPVDGIVGVQTWTAIDRLTPDKTASYPPLLATPAPAPATAAPKPAPTVQPVAATPNVPANCTNVAKAICVSKAGRSVTLYEQGKPTLSMEARFGDPSNPNTTTHNGTFTVLRKYTEYHSKQYNNASMPYSMFFTYDGEAIHYSPTFAWQGYNGTSKGCVNVRDMAKIKQLYAAAPIGTRVVVY